MTEHDDIMLRNGEFEGDCGFRIFLRSNIDDVEQEFHFFVPANEINSYSRSQKMELFNKAVDVVQDFAGTELRNDSVTEYKFKNDKFLADYTYQKDVFDYRKPYFMS